MDLTRFSWAALDTLYIRVDEKLYQRGEDSISSTWNLRRIRDRVALEFNRRYKVKNNGLQ